MRFPLTKEDWKMSLVDEILVGPEYQASVPTGLLMYGESMPYDNVDSLLWQPGLLQEKEIEEYLRQAGGESEKALQVLLQAGHDPTEALRRLSASPALPSLPQLSREECERFEEGLGSFGKDFRLIHLCHLRSRSIGELVHYYYLWKKSARYDIFPHHDKLIGYKRKRNENYKNYKRKDKLHLNPNITDFMGAFMDQDLNYVDNPAVKLLLSGGQQIKVKEEPFIKEERVEN